MRTMKAVILCGGAGHRLRPLTETVPEALLKVMNRPVLDIIINKLTENGVNDISLALGYKAEEIISFCREKKYPANIKYCEEKGPLGTAGGLKTCFRDQDEDIIVINGNIIFDYDIEKAFEHHKVTSADITVIGYESEEPGETGVITVNENGIIIGYDDKNDPSRAKSNTVCAGFYLIKGTLLDLIPENTRFDFENDFIPLLIKRGFKAVCCKMPGYIGKISDIETYAQLNGKCLAAEKAFFDYPGRLFISDTVLSSGAAVTAPCLIAEGAVIGSGSTVGPGCVIGSGTVIGNGCSVVNSVIGSDVIILADCDIRGAVIGDSTVFEENSAAESDTVTGYGVNVGRFSRIMNGSRLWPGVRIIPEAVISEDVFIQSDAEMNFDGLTFSGKINEQLSLSDAIKTAQSVASLNGINRAGVAYDGKEWSRIYASCCISGLRSCSVDCYDFGSIFLSQKYFYSCYCSLDAFIYVSCESGAVTIEVNGRYSFPFFNSDVRKIVNNCKYRSFSFAGNNKCGAYYEMELFASVYRAALRKKYSLFRNKIKISFEGENGRLRDILSGIIVRPEKKAARTVRLLFDHAGTEVYFIENDKILSSNMIRIFLSEMNFVEGRDIVIPDYAPYEIEVLAEKFGRKAYRSDFFPGAEVLQDCMLSFAWCFDAVFLAFEILSVSAGCDMTLAEMLENGIERIVHKKIFSFECAPAELRRSLAENLGGNIRPDGYYLVRNGGSALRLRQLGNSSKIKILAEAEGIETAKELTADVLGKIRLSYIDNN